jgi:hypothetical protein
VALVDARHRRWIVAAALLGAGAAAVYVPYRVSAPSGPRGSSPVGLAFGVAAAALMVFEAALNLRRRVPTWRIGRAETWLKGHVWLGLVIVPLVFFHAGFRLGGALSTALTLVFLAMIASGVYGLVLQQYLPRLMTTSAAAETVFEQIPHVIEQLRVEAYEIAATVCGPLDEAVDERAASERIQANPRRARQVSARRPAETPEPGSEPLRRFYLEQVRPFLVGDGRRGPLASAADADRMVEALRRALPPSLHEAARDLGDIAAERRDLAVQRRMHLWLHTWLLVHVPLTTALFALLAAHVWWAVRYSY